MGIRVLDEQAVAAGNIFQRGEFHGQSLHGALQGAHDKLFL